MEDKKFKPILIASHGVDLSSQLANHLANNHDIPKVIVIEDDIYTIEVNGIKYRQIHHDTPKSGKFKMVTAMMAAYMPSVDFGGSDYVRKRPKVDLIKEYGLIELKQSKLCRADRDWIVWQFERNYKKI